MAEYTEEELNVMNRCRNCNHVWSGGDWEDGDGYLKCDITNEIFYYSYGPCVCSEVKCPLQTDSVL